jgi:hypothetical protein
VFERIEAVSDPVRELIEELWPELVLCRGARPRRVRWRELLDADPEILSRALGILIRPAHTENDSLLCDRNVGEGPRLSLV